MAGPDDPWPLWAQEAAGTSGAPTLPRVLVAGALVVALVNLWPSPPATHSGRTAEQRVTSPACSELARLRAHGVTSGTWQRQVRAACARAGGR